MKQDLNNQDLEFGDEEDLFDAIDDSDYVFIMDAEGNLKTVMLPEDYASIDVPEKIQTALQLFGVKKIEPRILH